MESSKYCVGDISFDRLNQQLNDIISDYRRIQILITKKRFEQVWEHCPKEQKDRILRCIYRGDDDALRKELHNHPAISLGEKTIRELKIIAARLGIYNWSRMNRQQLIREIHEIEQKSNDRNAEGDAQ